MSDDIPIIFAAESVVGAPSDARIVYLSAANGMQMQQYAVAGWKVFIAEGFQSQSPVDLAAVPAQPCGQEAIAGATVISMESPTWTDAVPRALAAWRPACVKFNAAFQNISDRHGETIAAALADMGYTVLGAQWRDDNLYRMRSVVRLEPWAALEPRDWPRINIIALRDPTFAAAVAVVGRLYAAEERQLADLRVGHALRGDHIGRLEEALMVHQRRT